MSASQTTEYLGLPIFEATDTPTWQGDWNNTMDKIDSAIHEAQSSGGEIVQTTGDSTTAVMSQAAVTGQISSLNLSINGVANNVANKQDTLTSSGPNQNIKTINGESLLGSGNLTISGGNNSQTITNLTLTPSANATITSLTTTGVPSFQVIKYGNLAFLYYSIKLHYTNSSPSSLPSITLVGDLPSGWEGVSINNIPVPIYQQHTVSNATTGYTETGYLNINNEISTLHGNGGNKITIQFVAGDYSGVNQSVLEGITLIPWSN